MSHNARTIARCIIEGGRRDSASPCSVSRDLGNTVAFNAQPSPPPMRVPTRRPQPSVVRAKCAVNGPTVFQLNCATTRPGTSQIRPASPSYFLQQRLRLEDHNGKFRCSNILIEKEEKKGNVRCNTFVMRIFPRTRTPVSTSLTIVCSHFSNRE